METDKLIAAFAKYADAEVIPQLSAGRKWAVAGAIGAAGAFLKAKTEADLPVSKEIVSAFFDSAFAAEPKVTVNPKELLRKLMSSESGPVFDLISAPLDVELVFDREAADKFIAFLP